MIKQVSLLRLILYLPATFNYKVIYDNCITEINKNIVKTKKTLLKLLFYNLLFFFLFHYFFNLCFQDFSPNLSKTKIPSACHNNPKPQKPATRKNQK